MANDMLTVGQAPSFVKQYEFFKCELDKTISMGWQKGKHIQTKASVQPADIRIHLPIQPFVQVKKAAIPTRIF
jgi:hypothetical protein